MTDPITSPLTLVGDPSAAVCEGDFCEIPDHHEQAMLNSTLDEDAV